MTAFWRQKGSLALVSGVLRLLLTRRSFDVKRWCYIVRSHYEQIHSLWYKKRRKDEEKRRPGQTMKNRIFKKLLVLKATFLISLVPPFPFFSPFLFQTPLPTVTLNYPLVWSTTCPRNLHQFFHLNRSALMYAKSVMFIVMPEFCRFFLYNYVAEK